MRGSKEVSNRKCEIPGSPKDAPEEWSMVERSLKLKMNRDVLETSKRVRKQRKFRPSQAERVEVRGRSPGVDRKQLMPGYLCVLTLFKARGMVRLAHCSPLTTGNESKKPK